MKFTNGGPPQHSPDPAPRQQNVRITNNHAKFTNGGPLSTPLPLTLSWLNLAITNDHAKFNEGDLKNNAAFVHVMVEMTDGKRRGNYAPSGVPVTP